MVVLGRRVPGNEQDCFLSLCFLAQNVIFLWSCSIICHPLSSVGSSWKGLLWNEYASLSLSASWPGMQSSLGSCPTLGHSPRVQSLHCAICTLSLHNCELHNSFSYKACLICRSLMIPRSRHYGMRFLPDKIEHGIAIHLGSDT